MADRRGGLHREAPKALIIAGITAVALIAVVVGYYVVNGGWKTPGQQDEDYKHNLLPIIADKHGDMKPLEDENALRKARGQAPLVLPKDTKGASISDPDKLRKLREQLQNKGG